MTDFLLWHDDGDRIAEDIVDPHEYSRGDAGPKWSALASYAQRNLDHVRRCLAVIEIGGKLRALDLTADGIAERLATATKCGAGRIDI